MLLVPSVLSEDEAEREIVVHPDDEALDNQPTLFQQMLGTGPEDLDSGDEEEEEEEEKNSHRK